ncbi:DUF3783 domain-containing protein [Clostridium beijerinckii]|uniref:DUF3783 domain-containing protein n=1 Tax=Clostridium beijerinckii TaxID=1520 RepID=A0A1S9MZ90_CLOBE|nr:DUF3783 domain-containing protein [Clostridium beijerinckii]MBA8936224.1 hypothetical protein [Clostridium beijerinckii]MZK50838.1 DUF3783 domain-containing protein [Clostridium beijerinckii]MZK59042.1 DUF3783 domain-containing protein [Clostridium beijerinckii]MZK69161.1 DUF3783 domain-containing protein [Clostridium beijerinckii]MZK74533.1 DUF3783 domain-containing protein [Clostridium beijerinckii]
MATNNKCILAYGLKEDEIKKIESQNIKVIEINNNMTLMTLEDIINGNKNEDSYDEMQLSEKALIFNGFKDEQLKVTIRYIRSFIQGGVLAVSTAQNYKWTFKYLLEHLIEEREWYKEQQKGRK